METIKIVYHYPDLKHIEKLKIGDWIDLRAAKDYILVQGEYTMIDLGVSMKLPKGYEAHVVPRSSTFKHYGILMTNSFGVIDNSYSGTNDIWKMPVYATRGTVINKNDRICQFCIVPKQPEIVFEVVNELDSTDRGGFGSSGVQ